MTSALVQFMWLEAVAKPMDLVLAALVGAVLWHFTLKAWIAFVGWVWARKGSHD